MGGTPILGIVLGVTLVSPQLMNAYLLGQQTPDVWNFGVFSIEKNRLLCAGYPGATDRTGAWIY